jgi:ubiquinone/menaquinone biosynthesis C-methylase UbiE
MQFIRQIRSKLNRRERIVYQELDPPAAYDCWAGTYDAQPDNLLLAMETAIFRSLLRPSMMEGRVVVDIGCGTGRHWHWILEHRPREISGYDASAKMLEALDKKLPGHKTRRLEGPYVPARTGQAGLLISTLTLAHINDASTALSEWCRVLEPGGFMVLTDYHPDALTRGAARTFRDQGKTYAITSHAWSLVSILGELERHGMSLLEKQEKCIGPDVCEWYDRQGAMDVYERYLGMPVVYGLSLQKKA